MKNLMRIWYWMAIVDPKQENVNFHFMFNGEKSDVLSSYDVEVFLNRAVFNNYSLICVN